MCIHNSICTYMLCTGQLTHIIYMYNVYYTSRSTYKVKIRMYTIDPDVLYTFGYIIYLHILCIPFSSWVFTQTMHYIAMHVKILSCNVYEYTTAFACTCCTWAVASSCKFCIHSAKLRITNYVYTVCIEQSCTHTPPHEARYWKKLS